MRLFIAEKPELGRAIAEALGSGQREGNAIRCGNGDMVTWCFGHLLTLTDPEDHDETTAKWAMEKLPLRWPIKHKPIKDKASQIQLIKKLARQASEIIHAGDPDEEGQLLVDEVLDYIGNTKPVRRVLINDLNKSLVQKAIRNLRDNQDFYGMYQSALARSVSDQVYGYNLTRVYTLAGRKAGANQVLSVGRVQTPILGLVVRRDRAHEDHKAHYFYEIKARLSSENQFTAKYQPNDSTPVDDKNRVIDAAFADQVVAAVRNQTATDIRVKTENKEASPPLPYNLLNLQADAARKFGFSPDKTLKVTQALREQHRLITYNRSDCQYLSNEQHADGPEVLKAIAGTAPILTKAAQAGDPSIKSRAFNSKNVSAHHAIVPTSHTGNIEKLNDAESKLYMLIARAYIAQFWPKHTYRETRVDLKLAGHDFRSISKVTINEGWKKLYKRDADNTEVHEDTSDTTENLEWVKPNSDLLCTEASSEKKETKPPPRYTMAALLKDLARVSKYVTDPKIKALLLAKDEDKKGEHGGIGTPATRSAIIEQLIKRGYITEEKKKVISTPLGREFFDLLPAFATAPDMTALWHEQQEDIRSGRMSMQAFVDGVFEQVANEVNRIKAEGVTVNAASGRKCSTCNQGQLVRRKGKNGFFWGCSAYPDCKATFPDKRGKPDLQGKKSAKSSEHKCPECDKGLIRRQGKRKGTYWWGCSGYPSCSFRAFDKKGKPELAVT